MIDLPVKTEPVMVIMGAGVAAVNAVLAVILAFVPVEPSQAAVLVAVVNPLAALRDPTKPGCLGTTPLAALGGATGRQAVGAGLGAAAAL